jgi:tetraacyldisaccharide 4'-kinase
MFRPESLPFPVRWVLRLASLPYGVIVRLRNTAFDRGWKQVHRVPVPVISIGNLTLGGTGKTPCVEYVASYLREQGRQVCLLSRGYKSSASGINDEAMLLEENLPDVPHLQNPDRVTAAQTAIEELEADVLVLDDGFQHRRLHRDLDIVLIDVTHPPHRDLLFPGGTLREPATGLKRAGVVILTRCDSFPPDQLAGLVLDIMRLNPIEMPVPVVQSVHEPVELIRVDADPLSVSTLRGRTVGMVSGIGNPAAFRRTLESLGATVVAEKVFPDHHGYTKEDVVGLRTWARSLPEDAWIAVTQKDHVKLRIAELAGRAVVAVRVGLKITWGEDELRAALDRVIGEPDA